MKVKNVAQAGNPMTKEEKSKETESICQIVVSRRRYQLMEN